MQDVNRAFRCKKCGYCCRTLVGFSKGWLKGLGLTKEETLLFDKRYIFPQLGIGINRPEYIYFYQLGLAVCPYITENNECSIYDKRPMICRCYPFEMTGFTNNKKDILITIECTQMTQLKKGISEDDIPKECEEMYTYMRKVTTTHYKKDVKFWNFDLATKKWMLKK